GRIAIVDFAAHDREDLRQTHAHARLGFSDTQIWAMPVSPRMKPARSLGTNSSSSCGPARAGKTA
ncbi:MAG: hypothetical protein ACOVQ0_04005, partial [Novosphingobium sp.]